jgi:acetyl-CoA synthetase
MVDNIFYPKGRNNSFIKDLDEYKKLYQQSINHPEEFFGNLARENIEWIDDFDSVHNGKFSETKWFEGGKTNISVNCIDRHLKDNANKTAIIWEGDNPDDFKELTYQELHDEVCKFANVLKNLGVKKGSRVCIYMPMIVEVAYAMLACTRIGAIHSVVFGGFSPESLKDRILDADCRIVITADEGVRGGKAVSP